jgi:hypothetical protein
MIRFKEAAEQIKRDGPKELTVRQLLALFGQQRRGRRVAAQIRRALKREKLETVPNFEVVYMDASVLLRPKTAEALKEEKKAEAAADVCARFRVRMKPIRLGSLNAAIN